MEHDIGSKIKAARREKKKCQVIMISLKKVRML